MFIDLSNLSNPELKENKKWVTIKTKQLPIYIFNDGNFFACDLPRFPFWVDHVF